MVFLFFSKVHYFLPFLLVIQHQYIHKYCQAKEIFLVVYVRPSLPNSYKVFCIGPKMIQIPWNNLAYLQWRYWEDMCVKSRGFVYVCQDIWYRLLCGKIKTQNRSSIFSSIYFQGPVAQNSQWYKCTYYKIYIFKLYFDYL